MYTILSKHSYLTTGIVILYQGHLGEGLLICILEKDLLAITIDLGLQEDGAGVLGGEIDHLDDDHAHLMEEIEKETEKGIGTEGGIGKETGIGTKIATLRGKEIKREVVAVTEKLRKEKIGFQHQRRKHLVVCFFFSERVILVCK